MSTLQSKQQDRFDSRNGFLNTKQSRRPRFLHPSIRPPDPNLRAPDFSPRPPLPNLQPTVFNGGSGSGRPEFQDQIGSFDFQKPVFIKTFPKPVFRDVSAEPVFNRNPVEPLVFTTISPVSGRYINKYSETRIKQKYYNISALFPLYTICIQLNPK